MSFDPVSIIDNNETISLLEAVLTEKEVRELAEDHLDRDLLARGREKIEEIELVYVPLWRLHFSESWEKVKLLGFIGGGKKTVKDSIYLHPSRLSFAYFNAAEGFEFLSDPFSKRASEIGDLDNYQLSEVIKKPASELPLDRRVLRRVRPEKDAASVLKQRYKIAATKGELIFVPMFRIRYSHLKEQRLRHIKLDGIYGHQMLY